MSVSYYCPTCKKYHGSSTVIEVASIPTTEYKEIIEIRVPTRFYWTKDGSFDGIEFGEFETTLMLWQEDMVYRCLEAIPSKLEE